MTDRAKLSVLAIDAAGGLVVGACVLAASWLLFSRSERTAGEIRELTQAVTGTRHDLTRFRGVLESQKTALTAKREDLERRGRLPANAPTEEYFQALTRLAVVNDVTVLRSSPVSTQRYPGLIEQRFAYGVSGTMSNLAQFLAAIEAMPYWADVSYLKLERGPERTNDTPGIRQAELTLSLFSSPKATSPPLSGAG